jgi:SAM-dependent methyltransferase
MDMTDAATPEYQLKTYSRGFYKRLRRVRWLFRYDCRYRLFLMEELFRKKGIPFERMKVYELGFGTGDLLFRFDSTSTLHGCEITPDAVEAIKNDSRLNRYRDTRFVCSDPDGNPQFPSTDYDLVIASHVLEHVPDDASTLEVLAKHAREDGLGLFFLPLERPGHLPVIHARTYTAAGFTRLLESTGWKALEVSENFRYASHWVQVFNLPSRRRVPFVGQVVEAVKNVCLSIPPTSFIRLVEKPLEFMHVKPRQLMVLARRR